MLSLAIYWNVCHHTSLGRPVYLDQIERRHCLYICKYQKVIHTHICVLSCFSAYLEISLMHEQTFVKMSNFLFFPVYPILTRMPCCKVQGGFYPYCNSRTGGPSAPIGQDLEYVILLYLFLANSALIKNLSCNGLPETKIKRYQ